MRLRCHSSRLFYKLSSPVYVRRYSDYAVASDAVLWKGTVDHFLANAPGNGKVVGSISTLDRSKLTPADHIDLSGESLPLVSTSSRPKRPFALLYTPQVSGSASIFSALPFPNNTRGFLFYTPQTRFNSPLSGEVRFRVCGKDAQFSKGMGGKNDLRFSTNQSARWCIPLLMVLNYPHYPYLGPLHELLVEDGFVTAELTQAGRQALEPALSTARILTNVDNILFHQTDSFRFSFDTETILIWRLKDGVMQCLEFKNPLNDPRVSVTFESSQGTPSSYPYEGEGIGKIVEYLGMPCIRIVRVLSIHERPLVDSTGHGKSSWVPRPVAGQLLVHTRSKYWEGDGVKPYFVPFTFDALSWKADFTPELDQVFYGKADVNEVPKTAIRKINGLMKPTPDKPKRPGKTPAGFTLKDG